LTQQIQQSQLDKTKFDNFIQQFASFQSSMEQKIGAIKIPPPAPPTPPTSNNTDIMLTKILEQLSAQQKSAVLKKTPSTDPSSSSLYGPKFEEILSAINSLKSQLDKQYEKEIVTLKKRNTFLEEDLKKKRFDDKDKDGKEKEAVPSTIPNPTQSVQDIAQKFQNPPVAQQNVPPKPRGKLPPVPSRKN